MKFKYQLHGVLIFFPGYIKIIFSWKTATYLVKYEKNLSNFLFDFSNCDPVGLWRKILECGLIVRTRDNAAKNKSRDAIKIIPFLFSIDSS